MYYFKWALVLHTGVDISSEQPKPISLSLSPLFPAAGDLGGAVRSLRSLLLFYPSDKDSLSNLELYTETLGGDTEAHGTKPSQVLMVLSLKSTTPSLAH